MEIENNNSEETLNLTPSPDIVRNEVDDEPLGTTDGRELKADSSNYNSDAFEKPSVTVDVCICRYMNKRVEVLLVKRAKEPFKDSWAIPGGFLNVRKKGDPRPQESLEQAALRELKEETDVDGVSVEQLKTYGDPERDPRTRVVTVAYFALVPKEQLSNMNAVAGSDAKEVGWFPLKDIGVPLAFDHEKILKDLFTRLSGRVSYTPIAFDLVGKEFTWSDLKGVYEYLLNKSILEPNFRRKIKSMYVIKKSDAMFKPKTGRPASMMRFVEEKTVEF